MARMIDADALKGPLELQRASYARIGATERAEAYANCLWEIAQAPTVGGWISVKDRLPEVGVEVLWCAKYEPERVWPSHRFSDQKWDIRVDEYVGVTNHGIPETVSYGEACVPLYWMPLPEPPEEVSGE